MEKVQDATRTPLVAPENVQTPVFIASEVAISGQRHQGTGASFPRTDTGCLALVSHPPHRIRAKALSYLRAAEKHLLVYITEQEPLFSSLRAKTYGKT